MNTYTIKQVAERLGIPATTIRYYDKEGLLSDIERKASGYRAFSETDVEKLETIECLKKSGMSIREIRQVMEWSRPGFAEHDKIIEMYEQRRQIVVEQVEELQKTLEFIECHKNYHIACRDNDQETIKAEYAHCAALLKELKK